jgi:proteasome assembly chaperone (PAC2) family protein
LSENVRLRESIKEAGLLVGLAKLKGMRGFCLLAETLGVYPDAIAAQALLEVLCKILHLKIDLTRLEVAANETRKILELYGLPRYQSKPDFPGFV